MPSWSALWLDSDFNPHAQKASQGPDITQQHHSFLLSSISHKYKEYDQLGGGVRRRETTDSLILPPVYNLDKLAAMP